MGDEKKCPCEAVEKLQKIVEEQDKRLNEGNVNFAVINTKLNLIMWVGATIAAALIGIILKLMLGA